MKSWPTSDVSAQAKSHERRDFTSATQSHQIAGERAATDRFRPHDVLRATSLLGVRKAAIMNMALRLPAFSRSIMDLRVCGLVPEGHIVLAAGWELARGYPWRCVVPLDEDPVDFNFAFLAGLSCLLYARTRERADHVAVAAARFRPLRLIGVILEPPELVAYVKHFEATDQL